MFCWLTTEGEYVKWCGDDSTSLEAWIYSLCSSLLLEGGKDAFHNEIHLTFDYIHKYDNECMDMTIALCFKERLKGEYRFMYHER